MLPLARFVLAFAAASLAIAAPGTAQARGRDAHAQPRAERKRQGTPGLDKLERRVRILNVARRAYDEAGHERSAESLAATVRYGRLLLNQAEGDALAKAVAGVPSMDKLIELLHGANKLLANAGKKQQAKVCRDLALHYSNRERERGGHVDGVRVPPQPPSDLHERHNRIKILRATAKAHTESGNLEAMQRIERILTLAEVQLADKGDEAVAKAAAGLTQNMIIESVAQAAELYDTWGFRNRADECRRLVQFYRDREAGKFDERRLPPVVTTDRRAPEPPSDLQERANRIAILRVAAKAHMESGRLEAARQMERILHLAELQLEGNDQEAIAAAAQGLTQDMIIDLVASAAEQLAERGMRGRAAECRRLVQFYRDREDGKFDAAQARPDVRAGRLPPVPTGDLGERENRIKILRVAGKAHVASGDLEAARQMERILRLAELQLAGDDQQAIAEAAQGLTQDMILELVATAAERLAKTAQPARASQCLQLVQFYQDRAAGRIDAAQAPPTAIDERRDPRERQRQEILNELQRRLARMHKELDEIEALMRRLDK